MTDNIYFVCLYFLVLIQRILNWCFYSQKDILQASTSTSIEYKYILFSISKHFGNDKKKVETYIIQILF